MISQTVKITCATGVHLRPAMELCEQAQNYDANIMLSVRNAQINLKSILNVLAARICQGDEVTVICDGKEEEQALQAMLRILEQDET